MGTKAATTQTACGPTATTECAACRTSTAADSRSDIQFWSILRHVSRSEYAYEHTISLRRYARDAWPACTYQHGQHGQHADAWDAGDDANACSSASSTTAAGSAAAGSTAAAAAAAAAASSSSAAAV